MLHFRAVLVGVKDLERTQQILTNSQEEIDGWKKGIFKQYPNGAVEVYRVVEQLVGTYRLEEK